MKNVLSKVVMLPTEKATSIVIDENTNKLFYDKDGLCAYGFQFLYFTTNEEIKEGDWGFCYDVHNSNPLHPKEQYINPVRKHTGGNCSACKKIVASTDESLGLPRPSNEFLKAYCEQGGINEVLIEYYEIWSDLERNETEDAYKFKVKVAPDNTITIHPVKQKESWSREEVEALIKSFSSYKTREFTSQDIDWLKQNLK